MINTCASCQGIEVIIYEKKARNCKLQEKVSEVLVVLTCIREITVLIMRILVACQNTGTVLQADHCRFIYIPPNLLFTNQPNI